MNEEFEKELADRAAALPRAVAPERDLWPDIERAITDPASRRSNRSTVWARAASVLLLVGASSGITYLMMNERIDPTSPVAEAPRLIFEPAAGRFGSQYHLGPGYVDARRSLAGSLDEKLQALPDETRDEVAANLETIRKAINDINRALAEEPDNVLLQELLRDSYREELNLMITVDGVARAAMRRGDI